MYHRYQASMASAEYMAPFNDAVNELRREGVLPESPEHCDPVDEVLATPDRVEMVSCERAEYYSSQKMTSLLKS